MREEKDMEKRDKTREKRKLHQCKIKISLFNYLGGIGAPGGIRNCGL